MNIAEDAKQPGVVTVDEILNMRRTVLEIKKTKYDRRSVSDRQGATPAKTGQCCKNDDKYYIGSLQRSKNWTI